MPRHNRTNTKIKRTTPTRIEDYPYELQGPSQNKHGGRKTQRLRGFRGNTYGPASPVRQFTTEQIAEYTGNAIQELDLASSFEV